MWIDVKIPYEPGNRLAEAYNRSMEDSSAEWVLLLDHDVFFCNPNWYGICIQAIEQVKDTKAGLLTCVTNGTHRANNTPQKADRIIKTDCLHQHIQVAKILHEKYKYTVTQITWPKITGFFMLVKRSAWEEIKFKGQDLGYVDWHFSNRLLDAGFEIYLMKGLYMYHQRGMGALWKRL